MRTLRYTQAMVPLLAVLLAACSDAPSALAPDTAVTEAFAAALSAANAELMGVRTATARFHSTTQALAAGYQPDEHCVAVPGLGGMGYHWINMNLVDPVYDPRQPEVLLYETGRGGRLRLTGVEYIVIDVGQPHPTLAGHPFDVGGVPPLMEAGVPHWSLHVWLYKDNPNGMFVPFNLAVNCP
jgi:hypothetical protein